MPRGLMLLYRAVFLGCVVLGAVWSPQAIWQLVDLCNALMALPNLAPQALEELRRWNSSKKMEKPY